MIQTKYIREIDVLFVPAQPIYSPFSIIAAPFVLLVVLRPLLHLTTLSLLKTPAHSDQSLEWINLLTHSSCCSCPPSGTGPSTRTNPCPQSTAMPPGGLRRRAVGGREGGKKRGVLKVTFNTKSDKGHDSDVSLFCSLGACFPLLVKPLSSPSLPPFLPSSLQPYSPCARTNGGRRSDKEIV
jgi:hypothetical protein